VTTAQQETNAKILKIHLEQLITWWYVVYLRLLIATVVVVYALFFNLILRKCPFRGTRITHIWSCYAERKAYTYLYNACYSEIKPENNIMKVVETIHKQCVHTRCMVKSKCKNKNRFSNY